MGEGRQGRRGLKVLGTEWLSLHQPTASMADHHYSFLTKSVARPGFWVGKEQVLWGPASNPICVTSAVWL